MTTHDDPRLQTAPRTRATSEHARTDLASPPGAGWVLFAGFMLALAGILNVIYGIAAIDDSRFFFQDVQFVLSDLNTWGWVLLALGALQIGAAVSVWNGNAFGRWFGVTAASLSAIGALLVIPAYPFWSLALFSLDILIIYGLVAYGGQRRAV